MVSSLQDMTLERRLRAARTACAVMLGAAIAGLWGENIAFYVLILHAFIWLVLLLGKSATLRELDIDDSDVRAREEVRTMRRTDD